MYINIIFEEKKIVIISNIKLYIFRFYSMALLKSSTD